FFHPLILVIMIAFLASSCTPNTKRIEGFEIHGIDVSHHQGQIDWDTLFTQKIAFVILKATEGEDFKDSLFTSNWGAIKSSEVKKGAYHFFRPSISPEVQFHNFKETVILEPGDLPPVLDVEAKGVLSSSELKQNIATWLELAETHYKVKPIIYTYQKFYNEFLSDFEGYPLWIARYNSIPPELVDGAEWLIWQYGDRGRLPGISVFVDFNVFKGDSAELEKLLIKDDSLTSALISY
ncbi:MAG: GH25 family lysozyme, partial [Bacteroidota bacterium]